MEIGNRLNLGNGKSQGCGQCAASDAFTEIDREIELYFCYRHKKSDQNGRFFLSQPAANQK